MSLHECMLIEYKDGGICINLSANQALVNQNVSIIRVRLIHILVLIGTGWLFPPSGI